MRGLEKQLSCERLKVNLLVSRRDLVHIDTLDLCTARLRRTFLEEAAAELYVEEATLKQDLGTVLLDLELRQTALIRQRVARQREPEPVLTEAERTEALELLQDPQLVERILADYASCGLVGEETNKLVCYLACVSRLLPQPLSVLIQSSSAAGKSSLLEATLQFLPGRGEAPLVGANRSVTVLSRTRRTATQGLGGGRRRGRHAGQLRASSCCKAKDAWRWPWPARPATRAAVKRNAMKSKGPWPCC